MTGSKTTAVLGRVLLGLALLGSACSKKDSQQKAAPSAVAAKGSEGRAAPLPAPPGGGVPAGPAAKVAASDDPRTGCFAWSPTLEAAACITGSHTVSAPAELWLGFLGASEPAVKLGAAIDGTVAAAVNATLARGGYVSLDAYPARLLTAGAAMKLGDRTSITWTRTRTAAGGENQPPTHRNTVVVQCNGRDLELVRDETEGDNPEVSVRTVGEHVIVETKIAFAREGELGDDVYAAAIDGVTCEVASWSVPPATPAAPGGAAGGADEIMDLGKYGVGAKISVPVGTAAEEDVQGTDTPVVHLRLGGAGEPQIDLVASAGRCDLTAAVKLLRMPGQHGSSRVVREVRNEVTMAGFVMINELASAEGGRSFSVDSCHQELGLKCQADFLGDEAQAHRVASVCATLAR